MPSKGMLRSVGRSYFATLYLGVAILLSSCTPKQAIIPPDKLFASSASAPDQVSRDLTCQIYLDATSSMQGFARAQTGQQFMLFLQQIDRAFTTGWKSPQLKFWKFGDGKKAILDRPVYVAASRMAFYQDAPLSWKTRMDQVLRTAEAGVFTVVVTDLFQDESDEVSVVASLKEVTFNQRVSVGVLAVKAPFDGVVYDIGPGSSAAPYKGQRPLYALLVGRPADILHYVKQLSALGGFDADRHFLMLSPQLSEVPVGTAVPKVDKTPVGLRVRQFTPGALPYARLEFVQSSARSEPSITLDHNWEAKPYAPAVDVQKLPEPAISVIRLWQNQRTPYATGATAIGVKVRPVERRLRTTITIPATAFSQPGVYAVKISLRTAPETFSLPAWCQEWSMHASKLADSAQRVTRFDGTKTLNLSEFLGDLWTAMVNQNQPSLGDIYLYVSRDVRWLD